MVTTTRLLLSKSEPPPPMLSLEALICQQAEQWLLGHIISCSEHYWPLDFGRRVFGSLRGQESVKAHVGLGDIY